MTHRRSPLQTHPHWRHAPGLRHLLRHIPVRLLQQVHPLRAPGPNYHRYILYRLCPGRSVGGFWYKARKRMHKWSWTVWDGQAEQAIIRSSDNIPGDRPGHINSKVPCDSGSLHLIKSQPSTPLSPPRLSQCMHRSWSHPPLPGFLPDNFS